MARAAYTRRGVARRAGADDDHVADVGHPCALPGMLCGGTSRSGARHSWERIDVSIPARSRRRSSATTYRHGHGGGRRRQDHQDDLLTGVGERARADGDGRAPANDAPRRRSSCGPPMSGRSTSGATPLRRAVAETLPAGGEVPPPGRDRLDLLGREPATSRAAAATPASWSHPQPLQPAADSARAALPAARRGAVSRRAAARRRPGSRPRTTAGEGRRRREQPREEAGSAVAHERTVRQRTVSRAPAGPALPGQGGAQTRRRRPWASARSPRRPEARRTAARRAVGALRRHSTHPARCASASAARPAVEDVCVVVGDSVAEVAAGHAGSPPSAGWRGWDVRRVFSVPAFGSRDIRVPALRVTGTGLPALRVARFGRRQ